MSDLRCPSCGLTRDIGDNFCRRCGRQITVNLAESQATELTTETRARTATLIGSVAVLALGTGLEWAARRLAAGAAKTAARAAGRALLSRAATGPEREPVAHDRVAGIIEEVLYIRQVRVKQ